MNNCTAKSTNTPNGRNSHQLKTATCAAYAFSSVVPQEEMKLALVLNLIDPSVSGVLGMGHRGTGKSAQCSCK
jgi:Mg-chelatase subunit ChlI